MKKIFLLAVTAAMLLASHKVCDKTGTCFEVNESTYIFRGNKLNMIVTSQGGVEYDLTCYKPKQSKHGETYPSKVITPDGVAHNFANDTFCYAALVDYFQNYR